MSFGPIFIGGLAFSGKTQMRLMLSSHPNIAMTRRTYMWTRFFNRYGDLGHSENFERCLTALMQQKHIRVLEPDPDRIRREFWQDAPTYARLFALIHKHYAERLGKPRWGDQLGFVERFAAPIFSALPSAKMIHMIRDPRAVFEQLFGAGGTPEQRAERLRTDRSILDWVMGEMNGLRRQLGAADQQRLDLYTDNIRELEQRIRRIEAQNMSGEEREIPEAPVGVPDSFSEHMQIMFDLQVLAFMADTTRIFSLKMGRDASPRVYPESGTDSPYHAASHHGGREERVRDFEKINRYHVSMIPYFLEKLQSVTEGDGTLLDKTMVMYGSAMADSNLHNHIRCPLFLVGGANGIIEGEKHLRAPAGTPMANVMLDLLQKLGVNDLESFGNSTGTFSV